MESKEGARSATHSLQETSVPQGNGTNGIYGWISAMDTNGDSIDGFHLWSPKREQGAQHTVFKRHLWHSHEEFARFFETANRVFAGAGPWSK